MLAGRAIATALAALFLTAALFQPGAARAHDGGGGFHGSGFHGGPGGFQGGFAGFPHGGFHGGGFHAHGFQSERLHHHGFHGGGLLAPVFGGLWWGTGLAGLITLILTKATTATDLTHNTGIARTRRDITPMYSSATTVGRWFRPTDVGICRSCSRRLTP